MHHKPSINPLEETNGEPLQDALLSMRGTANAHHWNLAEREQAPHQQKVLCAGDNWRERHHAMSDVFVCYSLTCVVLVIGNPVGTIQASAWHYQNSHLVGGYRPHRNLR